MFVARRRKIILAIAALFTAFLLFRYPWFCRRVRSDALARLVAMEREQKQEQGQKEARPRWRWSTLRANALPILMPVCDRPEYLEKVLAALTRVHHIQETLVVVSQDCDNPAVTEVLQRYLPTTTSRHDGGGTLPLIVLPHIRPFHGIPSLLNNEYATAANVLFLLEFAFEYLEAKGAILLEADLVPAVDLYDYHLWAFRWFFQGKSAPPPSAAAAAADTRRASEPCVLTVNSFEMTSRRESDPRAIEPGRFTVWGWSTSADNFRDKLKPHWTWFGNWDFTVQAARERFGCVSVQPRLSHVKNIGRLGINFKETDDVKWNQSFGAVYIREDPDPEADKKQEQVAVAGAVDFTKREPIRYHWDAKGFCEKAGVCHNGDK